jgi:hypothetical protein
MRFLLHGYPTYHRAVSLYSSRTIVNRVSHIEYSPLSHHGSLKGKEVAVDSDTNGLGSALFSQDPYAGRVKAIEDKNANDTISRVEKTGVPVWSWSGEWEQG